MVILSTLLFCVIGYLFYSSKDEMSLMDETLLDQCENENGSFKDMGDVFNWIDYINLKSY